LKNIRLDKFISNSSKYSRNETKKIIKSGRVTVDGIKVKNIDAKIEIDKNVIKIDNKQIIYRKYTYIMINKPKDIICATIDNNEKTIIDLLEDDYRNMNLFPVGRLDKDTVGLVIITNDGEFAHNSLSPKKHITKTYYAKIKGIVTGEDIIKFKDGIIIDGGYKCKSSNIEIIKIEKENNISNINIEIREGKFHQIKRMFEAVNKKVLYLKRIKFYDIILDKNLNEGEYRELNEKEMSIISKLIAK